MKKYIFTREFGLQEEIIGFNARYIPQYRAESIYQILRPNLTTGQIEPLTEKTIQITDFYGIDVVKIEQLGNAKVYNINTDFNRFKFSVSLVANYPFGNNRVNIYDRPAIKKIIETFISKRQDEVFELFFKSIAGQKNAPRTMTKAYEILQAIFDLKDDFLKLIDQAQNINKVTPTYSEPTTTQKPLPLQPSKTTETKTVTTIAQSQPEATTKNKYILPMALLVALYVAKKKKLI